MELSLESPTPMETAALEEIAEVSIQANGDPDVPLVEAALGGDISAFQELVRRYDCKLLRIAQQMTHNLEDAEEAVQETFLKVYQKLNQFRGNSKFSTWLIRIVLNEALMKLRKRRFTELPLEYEDSDGNSLPLDLTDWSPNPEELCGRKELRKILRTALEALPQSLRIVFVLRDIEELSIKETAEILSLHPTAVKARHFRARLQLRERLTKHFKVSAKLAANSTGR